MASRKVPGEGWGRQTAGSEPPPQSGLHARSWAPSPGEQGNFCVVHLWLGFWPGRIVYSKPYGFTPRFRIVTPAQSPLSEALGDKASVSLEDLLRETDYKLGILPLYLSGGDSSRYPLLEPIIAAHRKSGKVREFSNSRNEMSIRYLSANRSDYIIRQRITHLAELRIDEIDDDYRFFRIDEATQYKLVAGACSDSELGREVIAKMNALIDDDLYRTYLGFRREWDPGNSVFDQMYEGYFLGKSESPFVTE